MVQRLMIHSGGRHPSKLVPTPKGELMRYIHHAALCKAVEDYCNERDNPGPDYAHRKRLRDYMLKLAKDGLDESE